MDVLIALAAHVAAGLVLLAGIGKVHRPSAARDALGLPRQGTWLVRSLGAAEMGLAVTVLVVGGRLAFVLLAAAYAGFVVVADRQRRAGRGCGCFGAATTATTGPLHLAVDTVAAGVALAAAWLAVEGLPAVLPPQVLPGVVTLGLVVVAVVLAQLTLTSLPELLAVRRVAAGAPRP